jgi:HEAT repeat protein
MKKKIFLLLVTCFFMTLGVSAQDPDKIKKVEAYFEFARKKNAALDAIAGISPALSALRENAVGMIIEATKTEDPALIPHLKVLASDEKWRSKTGRAEFQAHIALAKLGEPVALQEIFSEVDSRDYLIRSAAVAKLAQIGSKDAYRQLYELLDDTTVRDDNKANDVIIYPNSKLVMEELGKIFKDVPRRPNGVVSYDTAAWKAWFEKNKRLIE